MSYILEFVGAVAAGITIFLFVRGLVSRRAIDQLKDSTLQSLYRSEMDQLRDKLSGDIATRTTADEIGEMFVWIEDVELRDKMILERLAKEGCNLAFKMELLDSVDMQGENEIDDLRQIYRAVSYRIKTRMTEIQKPKTFTFLQKFLPEELAQHKEEIQEFFEDGIKDQQVKGKSGRRFELKETLHLALFIGKARIFKLSKIRRRTIK